MMEDIVIEEAFLPFLEGLYVLFGSSKFLDILENVFVLFGSQYDEKVLFLEDYVLFDRPTDKDS